MNGNHAGGVCKSPLSERSLKWKCCSGRPPHPSIICPHQTRPEIKWLKCKGIFNYYIFSLFNSRTSLLEVEIQHTLRNPVAHAHCQDTYFQLDIFLCFLVLACLGLLLFSLPLPSPLTPSLLNSPLLSPVPSLVSSFSQSLSQYVVLSTTVPCSTFMYSLVRRFLTARLPVAVFKLFTDTDAFNTSGL